MSQVKVFVTDGQRDRQTDERMSFHVPRFRERRGTKRVFSAKVTIKVTFDLLSFKTSIF